MGPMFEATWFVRSGDQEFGPLSECELQTLATKGTVGPSSFASTDRQTWRLLKDVQLDSAIQISKASTEPPPLPASPEEQWHVHSHDGKRIGPVPRSDLSSWIADGSVTADCLVWKEGTQHWQRAGSVFPNLSAAVPVQASEASADPLPVQVNKATTRNEEADDTNPAFIAGVVMFYVIAGAGFLIFMYYLPAIRRTVGPLVLAGMLLLIFIQWATSRR
jgi:hypothetical protein